VELKEQQNAKFILECKHLLLALGLLEANRERRVDYQSFNI
jgi:hypothetical protein